MSLKPLSLKLSVKSGRITLKSSISERVIKGRHDFISDVIFYKDDLALDNISEMTEEEFRGIILQYKEKVRSLDKINNLFQIEGSTHQNKELSFLDKIKNFLGLGSISNSFHALKLGLDSLNIIMIDKGKPIARTTIELDADIITILDPIQGNLEKHRVLEIQGINVSFVNNFFRTHVLKFVSSVQFWIFTVKKIIGIIGSAEFFYNLLKLETVDYIQFTIKFLGLKEINESLIIEQIIIVAITFVLVKYWKKMIIPVIKWIIKNKIHKK